MTLDIKRELAAVDMRDKDFYNNLTDQEKKEFSPYILMRYVSNVQGDTFWQEHYLEACNELVNKNHWAFTKNDKGMLWKLFAGCGTGQKMYHPYLAAGKKQKAVKIEKLLCELYPAMKLEDIKVQASLMDKNDITELFAKLGFDKKQRKEYE